MFAPHDVLVVVISDGMGTDAETERLIAGLVEHNDVLMLLVAVGVDKISGQTSCQLHW